MLPLADIGTAATGSITIAGTPSVAGTLYPRIHGDAEPCIVTPADTATTIATRLAALINADPNMLVTAVAVAGAVNLTARHPGLLGNDIDLRMNYFGAAGGEITPPGLTVTLTPMTGGTGYPAIGAALANLTTRTFDFVAFPYTDTTSLNAWQSFANDVSGRWSPLQELFGQAFSAYRGTLSARATFGVTRNDQHISIIGFYDSPSPVWDWTADLTGACGQSQAAIRASRCSTSR